MKALHALVLLSVLFPLFSVAEPIFGCRCQCKARVRGTLKEVWNWHQPRERYHHRGPVDEPSCPRFNTTWCEGYDPDSTSPQLAIYSGSLEACEAFNWP